MRRSRGVASTGSNPPGFAFRTKTMIADEDDRAADIRLVDDLLKEHELRDNEREAFEDIRDRLNRERFPQRTLTEKQRRRARDVADRLGVSCGRLASEKAESVPRGREVKAPDLLSKDSLKAALEARKGGR